MIKDFVLKASTVNNKWVVENGVRRNLELDGRIRILQRHSKFTQANVVRQMLDKLGLTYVLD